MAYQNSPLRLSRGDFAVEPIDRRDVLIGAAGCLATLTLPSPATALSSDTINASSLSPRFQHLATELIRTLKSSEEWCRRYKALGVKYRERRKQPDCPADDDNEPLCHAIDVTAGFALQELNMCSFVESQLNLATPETDDDARLQYMSRKLLYPEAFPEIAIAFGLDEEIVRNYYEFTDLGQLMSKSQR